jgi:hypothetical protein
MKQVSFKATKEEETLVVLIIRRAKKLGIITDPMSTEMDVLAANANGCPLDFAKLFGFDDFSFAHDIGGIARHLDRTTGKIGDFFLPRCAKPDAKAPQ